MTTAKFVMPKVIMTMVNPNPSLFEESNLSQVKNYIQVSFERIWAEIELDVKSAPNFDENFNSFDVTILGDIEVSVE